MAGSSVFRIGIVVSSDLQPRWAVRTVAALSEEFTPPSILYLEVPAETKSSPARGDWDVVAPLSFSPSPITEAVERLERRVHPPERNPFEPRPLFSRSGIPDPIRLDSIPGLQELDLDIAIDFSESGVPVGEETVARFGLWTLVHGGFRDLWGYRAAFDEVLVGDPTVSCSLHVAGGREGGSGPADSVHMRTDRQSLARTRSELYWRSSHLLRGTVRRCLRQGQGSGFDGRGDGADGSSGSETVRVGKQPSARESLRLAARITGRILRNRIVDTGNRERWILGYRYDPGMRGAVRPDIPLADLSLLVAPGDRSWADPFPVRRDGRDYVFLEEYGGDLARGHLSVFELVPGDSPPSPVPVLQQEHHLSHPFVFHWRGEAFLIPESRSAGGIELYRAEKFPYDWRREGTLLDLKGAVDATLHQEGDGWCLFVNRAPDDSMSADVELHLYLGPSPLGPWTPHPMNPVVTDVRRARPAGKLFHMNGRLIRPAQDCSEHYGAAVVLNEVQHLGEEVYRERPIARIGPEWAEGLIGTHTINTSGGLTVVDGLRREHVGLLRRGS